MPRGVYDRKESKIHVLEGALTKERELSKRQHQEIERLRTARRELEEQIKSLRLQLAEALPVVGLSLAEKLAIARHNIDVIASARTRVTGANPAPMELLRKMDQELEYNIKVLADLRKANLDVDDDPPVGIAAPRVLKFG